MFLLTWASVQMNHWWCFPMSPHPHHDIYHCCSWQWTRWAACTCSRSKNNLSHTTALLSLINSISLLWTTCSSVLPYFFYFLSYISFSFFPPMLYISLIDFTFSKALTYSHLQAVSNSIPENPKALSPWIHTTGNELWVLTLLSLSPSTTAAAMAKPHPTPIVPNVPASNLWRGR